MTSNLNYPAGEGLTWRHSQAVTQLFARRVAQGQSLITPNLAHRPDNVAHPADFKDERMWVYSFDKLLQTLLHFRRINCPGKEL
jgi:hypothetical protein